MSIKGYWISLFKKKAINIDENLLRATIKKHNVQEWFYYGQFKQRENYWNSWQTSFFLAKKLPSSSSILETGCGPGLNLFWFYQNGFKNVYGVDILRDCIEAGKELGRLMNYNIHLWVDNCTTPAEKSQRNYDAVMALNWTYLDPEFELNNFMRTYSEMLNNNGYFCIDIIDTSFNKNPNSKYLSSDWSKPENERRPTEYKVRYSKEDVLKMSQIYGMKLLKRIESSKDIIPKVLYILKKI